MSVLPDVLVPGLAVVFCGSAVGAASARRRAYYAGPGNAFWRTLSEVGLTPISWRQRSTRASRSMVWDSRIWRKAFLARTMSSPRSTSIATAFEPRCSDTVLAFWRSRASAQPKSSSSIRSTMGFRTRPLEKRRFSSFHHPQVQHGATGTRDPGVSSRVCEATPSHPLHRTRSGRPGPPPRAGERESSARTDAQCYIEPDSWS